MPFSMSVQFSIYISIVNISIWVIYNSISDQKMLLPLSFDSSSIKINKLSMSMKLLPQKRALIPAFGSGINHFTRYSHSITVNTLKLIAIIICKFHLSVKLFSFCTFISFICIWNVWIVFNLTRKTFFHTRTTFTN